MRRNVANTVQMDQLEESDEVMTVGTVKESDQVQIPLRKVLLHL